MMRQRKKNKILSFRANPAGIDSTQSGFSGERALRNVAADFSLWLALTLMMVSFRGLLLVLFRHQLAPESDYLEVLKCFTSGLQFDISMASYGVAPLVVLTLISFVQPLGKWSVRLRRFWAMALTVVCVLTFLVDAFYFQEYHDQFNHWIFGLMFDDRAAIAQTVWKSYPVVLMAFLSAALIAGLIWTGWVTGLFILRRFPLPPMLASSWRRWVTPVLIVALLILGMRASFDRRPVQVSAAATTSDVFLNKLVLNPFAALKRAIRNHQTLTRSTGLSAILPDGNVRAAAQDWFPEAAVVTNLDEYLKHTAQGSPTAPPQHVFIVMEESYDTWGMQPENVNLHANDRLTALARAGFAADAFVSGGDHTIASLSAMISGTLDTGINTNYQPLPKAGLPMAPAAIFKQLGYRTRFFYSGYPSWQRIGEFCREQGFEEFYSGVEMAHEQSLNEWGLSDEELFNYALGLPSDVPTFNVFMTISYHAPFSVDIDAKGFPRQALAKELAARGLNEEQTKVLGHLWYADKALGDFVASAEKKFPRALFAITGDHWSRREFNKSQTLLVQRAVPFVLYGPEVLRDVPRPKHLVGGHLDVVPTLIELSAPRGFEYYSFGRNMLDPAAPPVGYGSNTVVTPDMVVDVSSQIQVQDLNGRPLANNAKADELRLRYRQLSALNWWRVMKGPNL